MLRRRMLVSDMAGSLSSAESQVVNANALISLMLVLFLRIFWCTRAHFVRVTADPFCLFAS
jgi:hypothetical protein